MTVDGVIYDLKKEPDLQSMIASMAVYGCFNGTIELSVSVKDLECMMGIMTLPATS